MTYVFFQWSVWPQSRSGHHCTKHCRCLAKNNPYPKSILNRQAGQRTGNHIIPVFQFDNEYRIKLNDLLITQGVYFSTWSYTKSPEMNLMMKHCFLWEGWAYRPGHCSLVLASWSEVLKQNLAGMWRVMVRQASGQVGTVAAGRERVERTGLG